MTYGITLLEAAIEDAMHGKLRLGLEHAGVRRAELAYEWDETKFSATFHGHAPSLPVPAHPVALLSKPIEAIYALKTKDHLFPSDVFNDHDITINIA